MLNVRTVRKNELPKVSKLWEEFMKFNTGLNDSFAIRHDADRIFAKEMADRFADDYAEDGYHMAIAENDGEIVGFCLSYITHKPKYFKLQKFGFIGDLYVKPDFRRKGIGRSLVENAIGFFDSQKVQQIELLVAIKNDNAIEFWQSMGFEHLLTWMYKRI